MLYSVDFYWFSNTIIAFLRCSVNSHDKKIEKEATAAFSILSFICIGAPKLLGNLQVLTAIVGAASLTNLMRELHLAALRALAHAGQVQLPVGVTTLIATGLRNFSLRYCHGGYTSYSNLVKIK